MDLNEFQELKDSVDKARRRADRAIGAKEQILARLKSEHGCKTLEQAEALLEKEKRLLSKQERQLDSELQEFKKKWGLQLESEND